MDTPHLRMDFDIVCVGFGPGAGGFLTTLAPAISEFAIAPQVICYERADGLGFGVSGAVTKARGIRRSFPNLDPAKIPMAVAVRQEKAVYLFDPIGASRRSASVAFIDSLAQGFGDRELHAMELPWTPGFLHKEGGLILSIGQFNQWVGDQLNSAGAMQIRPGTPVAEPLIENVRVTGVRLGRQNGDPGTEVHAALTVIADGPAGAVGRAIDKHFGTPPGFERNDWSVGSKMVFDLPEHGLELEPGTVIHTLGYPEPEIFGFLYVHPDRVASAGIFIPSWFANPLRTSYRYLQHFIQHPYLWRYLQGAKLRSWGAKSILQAGPRGAPYLAGDGYARIGEGSGSTNVLTGSGVDEAWTTGAILAEGVIELLRNQAPFSKENLERVYVEPRRRSWVDREARGAANSRNGFHRGLLTGIFAAGLAGSSRGVLTLDPAQRRRVCVESYFTDRIPPEKLDEIWADARCEGEPLHERLMDLSGWPRIKYDGRTLVSHWDALAMGGKVQAAPGRADHVRFVNPELCETCMEQSCTDICSGEAIMPDPDGGDRPVFDREKCVHCGACVWTCDNIEFGAGEGGLHSTEN